MKQDFKIRSIRKFQKYHEILHYPGIKTYTSLMPRESHKNKCGARKIAKNGTAIDIDILFRRNYWTDKLILKF